MKSLFAKYFKGYEVPIATHIDRDHLHKHILKSKGGSKRSATRFTIKGTISKNEKGDITYNFTFTWNDVMDPNFIYDSDSKKAQFAKSIPGATPTDYKLSISWSDTTVIKAKPGLLNWNSGWLSK